MKTTILNGALPGDGFVDGVAQSLADRLASRGGQVQTWTLRDEKVAYCLGCFECWTKSPGICRIDDAGRAIAASIIAGDLVVYLTPVTFGGYSSLLKKAVDRSICLVSPFFTQIDGEVHHQPRYRRYPDLLGIGVLPGPHPAQERIFGDLVARNALNLYARMQRAVTLYRSQAPAEIAAALLRVLPAPMERIAA